MKKQFVVVERGEFYTRVIIQLLLLLAYTIIPEDSEFMPRLDKINEYLKAFDKSEEVVPAMDDGGYIG